MSAHWCTLCLGGSGEEGRGGGKGEGERGEESGEEREGNRGEGREKKKGKEGEKGEEEERKGMHVDEEESGVYVKEGVCMTRERDEKVQWCIVEQQRDELTLKSNSMSMYLPNRLELSFLFVLALPKA